VQSDAATASTVAATAAVAGGAMAFADDQPASPGDAGAMPAVEPEPVTMGTPLEFESAGHVLNFDTQSGAGAAPDTGYVEMDTQGLNFDMPDLELHEPSEDTIKLDLRLEEDNGPDSKFDFSGLDLDLGDAGGNDLELDEVATKLDLARAYVEMGDKEGAREILNEVLAEGGERQKADAKGMLSSLG